MCKGPFFVGSWKTVGGSGLVGFLKKIAKTLFLACHKLRNELLETDFETYKY